MDQITIISEEYYLLIYTTVEVHSLPSAFTLVYCSAYSSTLKMEAIFSSETSVDFQRTIQRYIPEYSTLLNHSSENLKYYKNYF
jgi:hypothetical protein